ncbi:hypothetical protein ITI46_32670 [Streptomyces oryzae]|uniref:DUF5709 domain-containing protein n=1 Tax=Streptomyces oryzae TaxID=1434886 RepID=A0ABS3XM23_9ACTN|nr:hypothetical protein [Streptomyces oryzae]MBO8196360.1 hypothetical protein [Streptomyces oryzae]
MSVDPTDPETIDPYDAYDAYDSYQEEPEGAGAHEATEAPEADTAEQQAELLVQRDDPLTGRSYEVDPADAAEQARVVELNEDEYR